MGEKSIGDVEIMLGIWEIDQGFEVVKLVY